MTRPIRAASRRRRDLACLGVAGAVALGLAAPAGAQAPARPATPPASFPAPARPVAPVVSPTWGQADFRDRAGEVGQITARLGLKPGMTVADIGAGEGYDSLRLAGVVGPRGQVVAEDMTPRYVEGLAAEVRRRGLANVQVKLGAPQDPGFAPRTLDAAIMVHMYHEIADPYRLLYDLAPAFKPGGRLGIEELDRPTAAHGTPPALLTCELGVVGYREVSLAPLSGGLGYFAVFAPPSPDRRPDPRRIRPCRG